MKRSDVKIGIVRMEGSNCEEELHRVFTALGAQPEMVHLNQLTGRSDPELRRSLDDYHVMMLPGGFSAGDYIRAGAIFAARLKSAVGKDLERFIAQEKPIGGFCNGFQIMVELGILPGLDQPVAAQPEAVLHINDSGHYECRPTLLRAEGKSAFTTKVPKGKVLAIPSAHAEGKLLFPKEKQARILEQLDDAGQVAFRYVNAKGKPAKGEYPWNPNGAPMDIAGITNPAGNVFGMMPHPERAFWRWQHLDWTRTGKATGPGDGQALFTSVLAYAEKKL